MEGDRKVCIPMAIYYTFVIGHQGPHYNYQVTRSWSGQSDMKTKTITILVLGLVLCPTSLFGLQCYQTTAASLTDIQVRGN